jgi:hypothetical protein
MNTLVILAILVLGCLALDIVILIITMQLMVRIEDVPVAGIVASPSMPSMQVEEYPLSMVKTDYRLFSY